MRGCRAEESIIPGPEHGLGKFQWFSRGLKFQKMQDELDNYVRDEGFLFSRLYEWRLNIKNGGIKERYLTGKEFSVDFPMINENFIGLKNKFAYCQVIDSIASSECGKGYFSFYKNIIRCKPNILLNIYESLFFVALPKFGSLVKFTFGEETGRISGVNNENF